MPNPFYTYQSIDPAECIGDSVYKIRNNDFNASEAIGDLNTLIGTLSSLLNIQIVQAVPPGAVHSFVQSTPPTGWISCEGVIVPNGIGTVTTSFGNINANFTDLHAAVSTKFGTAGQLPDLRGYFVRGHGINSDGTSSTGNLGRKQADAFKSHNHGGVTGDDSPDHSHTSTFIRDRAPTTAGNAVLGDENYYGTQDVSTGGANTRHTHTISSQGDTETRPKNISLLYCIKY